MRGSGRRCEAPCTKCAQCAISVLVLTELSVLEMAFSGARASTIDETKAVHDERAPPNCRRRGECEEGVAGTGVGHRALEAVQGRRDERGEGTISRASSP